MAMDLSSYPLGFRFHPTDAELVTGYLKPKILGNYFNENVIAEVDLCQSEPWELPEKSKIKSKKVPKERVWWFLCRRDYKSPSSKRSKRTTKSGFWKITGQERLIKDEETKQCIGRKKTLVFYSGASPGKRTNWVMQEITLHPSTFTSLHHQIDAYVICKLKRKTDESAETPEGEIHQMANSSGLITQEDILQMLHEDEFVDDLFCDPDSSDDPSIAQEPSKRLRGDTDAEGTNGLQSQGSSSFDSSSKKVRHSRMEKTPSESTHKIVLQADISFSDAVAGREVGPTHISVTGVGSRHKRVQFQYMATSDKAKEAPKHVAEKEVSVGSGGATLGSGGANAPPELLKMCVEEAKDDKKAVAKSAKSCESSVNASESWSFFCLVDSSSLSICDSQSPYEYGLNILVGTVLFAVFVRELVVFGSW